MNDSLLIDSGLPLEFWAEAMDTAYYRRNRLPSKTQAGEIIPEEAWTGERQDVRHLKVFGSATSVVIPKEKRHKSDIYKNWKRIFIGYSQDTTKHVRACAPKSQQILLVSSPYANESGQGAKLLVDPPLGPTQFGTASKRKAPTREPKPRRRPRKVQVLDNNRVGPPRPDEISDIDLARDHVDKDPLETVEKEMSATETSSKIHEPLTYEEAISDPVHSRQ